MSVAYLLITCEIGKEEAVMKQLANDEDVKEIKKTLGVYDIIAKVESDSEKDLKKMVSSKIRNMDPVRSVLVLESINRRL